MAGCLALTQIFSSRGYTYSQFTPNQASASILL